MSQKDEREFSNYYFLIPLIIILIIIPLVIVFSLNLGSTTQTTQTITIESPSIYVLKGYFNEGNKVDVSWEVISESGSVAIVLLNQENYDDQKQQQTPTMLYQSPSLSVNGSFTYVIQNSGMYYLEFGYFFFGSVTVKISYNSNFNYEGVISG